MNKFDLLFFIFKDTDKTSNDFKRAILQKKFPDIDINELHRKIINYQIEKYGCSLILYRPRNNYKREMNKMIR